MLKIVAKNWCAFSRNNERQIILENYQRASHLKKKVLEGGKQLEDALVHFILPHITSPVCQSLLCGEYRMQFHSFKDL